MREETLSVEFAPWERVRREAAEKGVPMVEHETALVAEGVLPLRLERFAPTVGAEGVKRLMAARVGVFGCGAIGGAAAEVLARCGVARFSLLDRDRFEETNLNRQIGALVDTLGRSKVDVLAARLAVVNPAASVIRHEVRFDEGNAGRFFRDIDVAVDAFDNFRARRLLHETALEKGVFLVSAQVAGFCGMVGVVCDGRDPFEPLWRGVSRGAESVAGISAAAAMAAGVFAAQLVLNRLLRAETHERVLFFDLETFDFRWIRT